jgi:hypothetical protein
MFPELHPIRSQEMNVEVDARAIPVGLSVVPDDHLGILSLRKPVNAKRLTKASIHRHVKSSVPPAGHMMPKQNARGTMDAGSVPE